MNEKLNQLRTAALSALALTLGGCGNGSAIPDGPLRLSLEVTDMAVPTDTVSAEPYLVADGDAVYMSWLDRTRTGHAMRLARMDGGAWGLMGTIVQSDSLFANWADVPSIAADGEEMWAHWLKYNGEGRYAYGVRVARSRDGGQTWGSPEWLHDDRSPAEHGFVSMASVGGRFQAVWLDGRQWADDVHEMTVHTRNLGESFGRETNLDSRACDCCPTDAAVTENGALVVAYRDRSADEIRDIYTARMVNGRWEDPQPVHEDGWQIAACPVNGAALDASGRDVVIAWFTAPNGDPQVNAAFSDDAGATWGDPIRLDTGGAIGRVDVVFLEDGTAVASWIQASGGMSQQDEAGVIVRRVAPDGRVSESVTAIPTSASRASGYPRMVRWGGTLIFAWTGTQPERMLRSARAVMEL